MEQKTSKDRKKFLNSYSNWLESKAFRKSKNQTELVFQSNRLLLILFFCQVTTEPEPQMHSSLILSVKEIFDPEKSWPRSNMVIRSHCTIGMAFWIIRGWHIAQQCPLTQRGVASRSTASSFEDFCVIGCLARYTDINSCHHLAAQIQKEELTPSKWLPAAKDPSLKMHSVQRYLFQQKYGRER